MSVVIIGGNDRMVCLYKNLCQKYDCKFKVFTQMSSHLKEQIGKPDLLILFTNTVSHKMINCAVQNVNKDKTLIKRSHSSSLASLENILQSVVNQ